MATLNSPRGTHDLFGESFEAHDWIIRTARKTAADFGCGVIDTPIFEFSQVFQKSLGEDSDVVSKEMYTFPDRGGEDLTLRPEGTAGIARAFLSNAWTRQTPVRVFYSGPMFRYERPQKGRQRQFHQLGVEFIGAPPPYSDLDILSLADLTLKNLGLTKGITLEINSIGDTESRAKYREQLVSYFEGFKNDLSEDSQRRLQQNPLRILDSKDKKDQDIVQGAPQLESCFNDESTKIYADILNGLENLGIAYTKNTRLVRGLDYYSHVVFEFKAEDGLGSQNTVLSGGRYDGLVKMMGGPSTPAVGFAAGIERLALLTTPPKSDAVKFVGVAMSEEHKTSLQKALLQLRQKGFAAEQFYTGNSGKQLKKAHTNGANYALLIGDDEAKANSVSIKDFATGEQTVVALDQLDSWLAKI